MTETSVYDAVGGTAFFERLVGDFYEGVAGDAVLASGGDGRRQRGRRADGQHARGVIDPTGGVTPVSSG